MKEAYLSLLRCPLCGSRFAQTGASLKCGGGHAYDFSRSGYVNFANRGEAAHYGRELWRARRHVFKAGAFAPLTEKLLELIPPDAMLLDAGCGEGSHLVALRPKGLGVGADISRDAVAMAASAASGLCWCVADLAAAPFANGVFGAAVNILSPANYDEFKRVLRPGGLLVKVIPGELHLAELRQLWGKPSSAPRAAGLFAKRLPNARRYSLRYTVKTSVSSADIAAMTPLGAHMDVPEAALEEVTFDFIIMAGEF